jgi:hypothetical protein
MATTVGSSGYNPALPGMTPVKTVVLAEKLYTVGNEGIPYCFKKCITHFGEDSIPYHPGEKSCSDRCLMKLYDSFSLAKEVRRNFNEQLKRQEMPPWVEQLEKEYSK